jgi:hypothetical protein
MSDSLVDIWPVEQQAPSTSSRPSLAHPRQWIRSDTKRYTHQGAAFRVLKIAPPTALAPPTLKSKRVPTSILRIDKKPSITKTPPPRGGALHRAPPSVRTFTSAVNKHQTLAPSGLVVCRQHTQSTTTRPRNHTTTLPLSTSYYKSTTVNMSSTSNLPPTYKHVLLRDRPKHARTLDLSNPRSRLAGHPLAPFLTVPLPPQQNITWAMLWTPPLVKDSRHRWS